MRRHKLALASAVTLSLAFLLYACAGDSLTGPSVQDPSPEPDPVPGPPAELEQPLGPHRICGDPSTASLVIGDGSEVGEVSVSNDQTTLSVLYTTDEPWELVELHLSVTGSVDEIPTNTAGLPQVGRFPHTASPDPGTTSFLFTISLDDLGVEAGDQLTVAAHGDVVDPGESASAEDDRSEGAWAEDTPFSDRGHGHTGSYFSHEVQDCSSVRQEVGSSGGDVVAEDVTITIPPGALDDDVTITVETVSLDELDDSELSEEDVDAIVAGTVVDLGPDGLEFDKPVEITIGYDEAALSEDFDEVDLQVAIITDVLELLPSSVDPDANTVSASVPHFTLFGATEPTLEPIDLTVEEMIAVTDEVTVFGTEELAVKEAVTVSDEVIVELGPAPIDVNATEEITVTDEVLIELGPAPIDLTVNESVTVSDEVIVELGAVPSTGDFAYVALEGADSVAVIDRGTGTITATIPVGSSPYAVAIRPGGAEVYVTNRNDRSVSVIDVATQSVVATIGGVVNDPLDVAFSPDGTTAYVVDNDASLVGVIDAATRTLTTRLSGSTRFSRAIAVTASGDSAFVAGEDSLVVFDLEAGVPVDTVGDTFSSADAVLTPDESELWVTDGSNDRVVVFNRSTLAVDARITGILTPQGIDIPDAGSTAYVADRGFALTPVEVATRALGTEVPLAFRPGFLDVSGDGTVAYVTEERGGTQLAVIDLSTGSVVTTLTVGSSPAGVALTP